MSASNNPIRTLLNWVKGKLSRNRPQRFATDDGVRCGTILARSGEIELLPEVQSNDNKYQRGG